MKDVSTTSPEPKATSRSSRRQWMRLAAACVLTVALGCIVAVIYLRYSPVPQPTTSGDALDVPLGVEEAVIIRYAGPKLVAKPYRRGASINLRIADSVATDGVTTYDVRYVVNLPGEFELTDYLTSTDGTELQGLPKFRVRGETRLTKTIETRIREIEDVRIEIRHWYYETLAVLFVLWILWLLGLIFVGRQKREKVIADSPPPPTIRQRIRVLLEKLQQQSLSVAEKAELELLLITHWKNHSAPDSGERLADACRRVRNQSEHGKAYETLQAWLHYPAG